jgi:hypothetical protein
MHLLFLVAAKIDESDLIQSREHLVFEWIVALPSDCQLLPLSNRPLGHLGCRFISVNCPHDTAMARTQSSADHFTLQ